jgi:citrate lyase beta subunit
MTLRKRESRIRRSLLFVPGDDMKKITKAAASGADSVIMDLEDGVALNRKEEARRTVAEALRTLDFGRSERLVRVNPFDKTTMQLHDVEVTLPSNPDGYVIPKLESYRDITQIVDVMSRYHRYWSERYQHLLLIIETARGVVRLGKNVDHANYFSDALIFGAEDLAGSMGATRTREGWEVFYARSAVVTHAAAYGLQAIDTPFVDLNDLDGLRAEAQTALHMGYTGKLAIHPKQIEPIHEVFTPSDEQIRRAQQLIEAHDAHQASGTGVFAYEGRMVDMPMIRAAERVIARAKAAGKMV